MLFLVRFLFKDIGKIIDKREAVFRIGVSTLSFMFIVFHIIFFAFALITNGLQIMMPINLMCILIYILIILMNRNEASAASGIIFAIIPAFYAAVSVYLIGWELGTQWYLLALIAPLHILNANFSMVQRQLCVAIPVFAMLFSGYLTFFQPDSTGVGDDFILMQFINILLALVTGAVAARAFSFCNTFNNSASDQKKIDTLSKVASTDQLTQLSNKSHLQNALGNIFRDEDVNRARIFTVLINIDDFRLINEKYGNENGDEVLKKVAEVITACFRKTDIKARWGGDTFIIVLNDTNEQGVKIALEKFRRMVKDADIVVNDSTPVEVNVTMGYSAFDEEDESYMECIKRSDEALIHGKKNGKNTVVNYDELS